MNRIILRKNRRVPSKETRIKCIYCEIKKDHCMEQREKDVKGFGISLTLTISAVLGKDGCLQ